MAKITQTSVFKDFVKNAASNTDRSAGKADKKDRMVILPYDLNIYDEVESVFFIRNKDGNYGPLMAAIEDDKEIRDSVVKTLGDFGIGFDGSNWEDDVINIRPLRLFDDFDMVVHFFFVNVSRSSMDRGKMAEKSIEEIDIVDLWKCRIDSLPLLYMLAVIRDVI